MFIGNVIFRQQDTFTGKDSDVKSSRDSINKYSVQKIDIYLSSKQLSRERGVSSVGDSTPEMKEDPTHLLRATIVGTEISGDHVVIC